MRAKIVAGISAAVIIALASFAGGMIVEQRLAQEHPTPVPAILPERPIPQPYSLPLQYAPTVIYWSDATGVPVWIAARLFQWESGFNASYRSRINENGTYDYGIAALNTGSIPYFQSTFNDGKAIDAFDAETSIRIGILYLASLYQRTGDWRLAVGAFNAGPGTAPRNWKPITVRHVKAVLGTP